MSTRGAHPTQRRRPVLVIAAVLTWVLALAVPAAAGGGRLERILGGEAANQHPVVGLAIVGEPTVTWTGIGRGTVSMNYEVTLTGAPSTTVRLTRGVGERHDDALAGSTTTMTLEEGRPHRGSLRVPVTCRNRVKVGVAATGPVVDQAEVFTWVQGTKDTRGNLACTLI